VTGKVDGHAAAEAEANAGDLAGLDKTLGLQIRYGLNQVLGQAILWDTAEQHREDSLHSFPRFLGKYRHGLLDEGRVGDPGPPNGGHEPHHLCDICWSQDLGKVRPREQVRSECHISFFSKSVGDTFDMIGQSYYLVNYNNRRAGFFYAGSCQVGLDGACLAVICRHGAQFICHYCVFLS
jgi:hypothetical protein